MEVEKLDIPGLLLIKPRIFEDHRGYFFESFNSGSFTALTGLSPVFVQDNESMSHRGVLRGLHLQLPPYAQGKLVRVVRGSVYDVAVDVRTNSETYGSWYGVELSAQNKLQLYIPPGFAHGFAVLENNTIFSYKCTALYHQESERCIKWDDEVLGIEWPLEAPIISEKDLKQGIRFNDFNTPF